MEIKKTNEYNNMTQRQSTVDHWLDEALNNDLIPHLQKAINTEDVKEKNIIITALLTYWNGVVDGNRFNTKAPNKEVLLKENGTRVFYEK